MKGKIFAWIMGAGTVIYLIYVLCDLFLFLNIIEASSNNSSALGSLFEHVPRMYPFVK